MEERNLNHELMGAVHKLGKLKASICFEEIEMTKAEFYCMGMIRDFCLKNPEKKGMYVWEIAEKAKVRPPAVSRLLKGLEQRNLIVRSIDSKDRRNIYVGLTDEGCELWEEAAGKFSRFSDEVAKKMGKEDMTEIIRLVNKLSDIIEKELENGDDVHC